MDHTYEVEEIQVIELHMMDKRKYFPLAMLSGFTIRSMLYPNSLIKTRLQVQKHNAVYTGTYDAFKKILRTEGFTGLYKGFWVTNLLVFTSMTYIGTYEYVRHILANHTTLTDGSIRSFIAGGCASLVGQTTMVPIDIVSQHLQIVGHRGKTGTKMAMVDPLHIPSDAYKTRFGLLRAIVSNIHQQEGPRGFYKGYFASLVVYAPSSAMWWWFYHMYCTFLAGVAPAEVPRLFLQVIAAPLSGASSTFIMTPMDAIRTRIQVEGVKFGPTARLLWREEGLWIFTKGLSARLINSISFSFFIILGYESIKRLSLLEEYKDNLRW